jgi:tRNA pseudouridine38-40 synthase
MKYALRISYIGRNYCGWQRQKAEGQRTDLPPSIQETVEAALSKMANHPVTVVGSGRTDAGVNALGQVVHFRLPTERFTTDVLRRGLNSLLPRDIRIMEAMKVPEEFHAQRSATQKQYSYYFLQGPSDLPQWRDVSWWIHRRLDEKAMQEAVSFLVGEHDFRVFQASGGNPGKSTVRTLIEAEVVRLPMPAFPGRDLDEAGYSMIRVRLVGTGFLKQMVRGIAGTLLQIGEKHRKPSDMADLLRTGDRHAVGPTAPAKGLTLERVWYKPDPYANSNQVGNHFPHSEEVPGHHSRRSGPEDR